MTWTRLTDHWQKDLKLWLFLMLMLTLFRGLMIYTYSGQMDDDSSWDSIFTALLTGIKFDARFPLIAIAPTFTVSLLIAFWTPKLDSLINKLRIGWGTAISSITLFLCIGDFGFYFEYHDHFNQWIFGLIYDDPKSLALTVWHDYPVVLIVISSILGVYGIYRFLKYWLQTPFHSLKFLDSGSFIWPKRIFVFLLTLFLIKCAVTCTLTFHNLSRKDTATTADPYLNKMVYSPYYALYSTFRDYKKRNSGRGIEVYWPSSNIQSALTTLYPYKDIQSKDILDYLQQTVTSRMPKSPPSHIFLIVLESQDAWPLLDEYSDFNLAPNLNFFAQNGRYFKNFLPAGVGTMPALNSIIMGIPEVGIETQYQQSAQKALKTAIAEQFKALGYKTNLFYGGYLSWRKLGELALNQGFEKTYGIGSMANKPKNEWGVDDRGLYEYILESLPSSPSFNLIMTTSNHPPYSINLGSEGFIAPEFREDCDESCDFNILGHSWYADKCLGEFVINTLDKYPNALFVITGDHWSRRFINAQPPTYERNAVPLILYGPNVIAPSETLQSAGAHIDIAPTLIHLLAPINHSFHSMGHDLLNPITPQMGFGSYNTIATPDKIHNLGDNAFLDNLYNAYHAIGWYRIKKGEHITDES